MSFRLIPPGKFTMGDGQGNSPAEDWTPHRVTLTVDRQGPSHSARQLERVGWTLRFV